MVYELKKNNGKVVFTGDYNSYSEMVIDAMENDISMKNINFSDRDLEMISFDEVNLSGSNFSNCTFTAIEFYDCKMKNCIFRYLNEHDSLVFSECKKIATFMSPTSGEIAIAVLSGKRYNHEVMFSRGCFRGNTESLLEEIDNNYKNAKNYKKLVKIYTDILLNKKS